jgi:hypothetical protein
MFSKHATQTISAFAIGGLMFVGCAGSRLVSAPAEVLTDVGLKAANQDIEAKVNYIVQPDGPGSWVKGAKWIELKVSLRTLTDLDMTLEKFDLIDHRGVYLGSDYESLSQLESKTDSLSQLQAGKMASTAMTAAGTAVAMSGAMGGKAGMSMMPILGGLTQLGSLTSMMGQDGPGAEAKDAGAIEAEFQKRRLTTPLKLSGKAVLDGGLFFPITPQPRALIIHYQNANGTEGKLRLVLDKSETSEINRVAQ